MPAPAFGTPPPETHLAASRPARRIVLCADDFAVNASASLGIAQLARLGRISATSAMVLTPRWPGDAARLQDVRAKVDVGLHLDWTSPFAVAAGHGLSLNAAMLRALLGGFERRAAQRVVAQQLDAFEAHWQAPPDYVDGHQHVQQFAGIRHALVGELQRRYGHLPMADRPYLRLSQPPLGTLSPKAWVIAAMGAKALAALARQAGLRCGHSLLGVYDFAGSPQRYAQLMQRWLAQAPAASILMCHPAQAAEPDDDIGTARVQEQAYLSSPEFASALTQAGVSLARGRDLID